MLKSLLKKAAIKVQDSIEDRRQQQKNPAPFHYLPLTDKPKPTNPTTAYPGPGPYQQHNASPNPQGNEPQENWAWMSPHKQSSSQPLPLPARNYGQSTSRAHPTYERKEQPTLNYDQILQHPSNRILTPSPPSRIFARAEEEEPFQREIGGTVPPRSNYVSNRALDFSDFATPHQVLENGICLPCQPFERWLRKGVEANDWEPFKERGSIKENYFDLGFLDRIVATTSCRLCRLVSGALREKYAELPVIFDVPPNAGKARQEITLRAGNLVEQDVNYAVEVGIILLSDDVRLKHLQDVDAQVFKTSASTSVEFRVVKSDASLVPAGRHQKRAVGKIVPPGACDIQEFIEVYRSCCEHHGNICELPRHMPILVDIRELRTTPTVGDFRVIDIHKMCVVDAPTFCRYVALSYVWGKSKFLLLLKENLHILTQYRALEYQDLPKTVKEAIVLTGLLGERYLWVDALCIIQDDDAAKVPQITQMDKIYLSAALTLVTADGHHANSGFTGLTPNSRKMKQITETVGGVGFVTISEPIIDILAKQNWHTRAWTYQEFMLSKRILLFTDYQVHYICNLRTFCEDTETKLPQRDTRQQVRNIMENPHWNPDRRHNINLKRQIPNPQIFHLYPELVKDITSRAISTESDILRSVTGILKAMSKSSDDTFICGIPSSTLEYALLWQPVSALEERGPTYAKLRFPSWSWIGWKGAIKHHDYHGPSNFTTLIKNWQFYTPTSHDSETWLPFRPPEAKQYDLFAFNWVHTTWSPLPEPESPERAYEQNMHQATTLSLVPLIESGILAFTTQTVVFRIETAPHSHHYDGFTHNTHRILNAASQWIGTVNLGPNFSFPLPTSSSPIASITAPRPPTLRFVEAEFIAISKNARAFEAAESYWLNRGQNTFDTSIWESVSLGDNVRRLLVNVLWVRKDEHGAGCGIGSAVVRRVGIGQIHEDAWNQGGVEVRRVMLG